MTSKKNKTLITNYARRMYNHHFAYVRRRAKEENLDLSLELSRIIRREPMMFFLGENSPIPLPDTSKMKQRNRELCLKEWYRPYYYEWFINDTWHLTDGGFKSLKRSRKGARGVHKITQPKSVARKAPIIKERKKFLDSGVTDEKVILKLLVKKFELLVKKFSKSPYHYIQQTILAERYKEANDRRLQKPRALSP